MDVPRQKNTTIPEQSNFTLIFEEDNGALMIFIA